MSRSELLCPDFQQAQIRTFGGILDPRVDGGKGGWSRPKNAKALEKAGVDLTPDLSKLLHRGGQSQQFEPYRPLAPSPSSAQPPPSPPHPRGSHHRASSSKPSLEPPRYRTHRSHVQPVPAPPYSKGPAVVDAKMPSHTSGHTSGSRAPKSSSHSHAPTSSGRTNSHHGGTSSHHSKAPTSSSRFADPDAFADKHTSSRYSEAPAYTAATNTHPSSSRHSKAPTHQSSTHHSKAPTHHSSSRHHSEAPAYKAASNTHHSSSRDHSEAPTYRSAAAPHSSTVRAPSHHFADSGSHTVTGREVALRRSATARDSRTSTKKEDFNTRRTKLCRELGLSDDYSDSSSRTLATRGRSSTNGVTYGSNGALIPCSSSEQALQNQVDRLEDKVDRMSLSGAGPANTWESFEVRSSKSNLSVKIVNGSAIGLGSIYEDSDEDDFLY